MTLGRSAGRSDPGRKRRRNEDAFVLEPPLFAVADGMGGAQAGELASGLAAAALREDEPGPLGGEERVASLIREANRRVYQRSNEDAAVSGMGTTMTVALVEDGRVSIGHVGDSRAYLVRDGRLEQLTEDHSLVAELVRSGKLSPEEAESHPQRSVITRALGTDPDVDVDTFSLDARPGDVFLLCSDGLTSMVGDDDILAVLDEHRGDLGAAVKALIRAANKGGGEDNITVVCFEIAEAAGPAEETAQLPALDGAPAADEEDTLSGLDVTPAVDMAVVPPEQVDEWLGAQGDAQESAPAEEPQEPRATRRRLTFALALFVLVAGLCALALFGLSRAHFVGAEPDGHVALYQGVPWNILGSVRLYRPVYVSPLLAAQLTRSERRSLFDHRLRSYRAALAALGAYERDVKP